MKKFLKLKLNYEENKIINANIATTDPLPPPDVVKCVSKKEILPPLPLGPPPNDNIETENVLNTVADHDKFKKNKLTEDDLNKGKPKQTHQEYYSTRYLPPHVLAHMINENNNQKLLMLPPPPPPPIPPPPSILPGPSRSNQGTFNYNVPPPPVYNYSTPYWNSNSSASCVTSNEMEMFLSTLQITSLQSTPKLDQTRLHLMEYLKNGASPGRGSEPDRQVPKMCKYCNKTDFMYQYNKAKLEKIKMTKEEIYKKISILDKHTEKLDTFIRALAVLRNVTGK